MKIEIEINKLLARQEYLQMKTWLELRGIKAEYTGSLTHSTFKVKDLFEDMFKLLYSDDARFTGYEFYIEVDKARLDEEVFPEFPVSGKLRDVIHGNIYENEDKAFFLISYKDLGTHRSSLDINTHELLNIFITDYAEEDLSNIYTQESVIKAKINEYNPVVEDIEVASKDAIDIEKMTVAELKDYMRLNEYDEKMTDNDDFPNFSEALKADLIDFMKYIGE